MFDWNCSDQQLCISLSFW